MYSLVKCRRGARQSRTAVVVASLMLLSGCASYAPHALNQKVALSGDIAELRSAPPRFHALSMAEVDRLVLANDPDLVAARQQLGVSRAQIELAGILPNPQASASYPFLVSGPGVTDSFSAGFTQDLKSLVTYSSRVASARAVGAQVNASLLWQEWQTLGKARLLYVQIVEGRRLEAVVEQTRSALVAKYERTKRAIDQGNATIATLSPDLVAVGDIEKTRNDLVRQLAGWTRQLNALLGLQPDVRIALRTKIVLPAVSKSRVLAELHSLPNRRPDLIALRFGYASAEEKLRAAVLSQFPNLAIGLTGGRDTSFVGTLGPQASFELPIFDRNQGNIAVASATRAQLAAEYSARLAAAVGEIRSLLAARTLAGEQLIGLRPRLDEARSIASSARQALEAGNLDERSYVDLLTARLSREQEAISLEQTVLETEINLGTVLGAGMPQVIVPTEPGNPLQEVQ